MKNEKTHIAEKLLKHAVIFLDLANNRTEMLDSPGEKKQLMEPLMMERKKKKHKTLRYSKKDQG